MASDWKINAPKQPINDPRTLAKILQKILQQAEKNDQKKEHFWGVGLNARNVIEYIELISLGTVNSSLVHPREVYRLAIKKSAVSLIIAHNHPSNNTEPSPEDESLTRRLREVGNIIGIELVDHLIITPSSFVSLKELGLVE